MNLKSLKTIIISRLKLKKKTIDEFYCNYSSNLIVYTTNKIYTNANTYRNIEKLLIIEETPYDF